MCLQRDSAWDKDAEHTSCKESSGAVYNHVSSKGPPGVPKADKPLADLFGNVPRGKRVSCHLLGALLCRLAQFLNPLRNISKDQSDIMPMPTVLMFVLTLVTCSVSLSTGVTCNVFVVLQARSATMVDHKA